MKLQSCLKVAHGRCKPPEQTVQHLESIIGQRYDYRLYEEEVAEHLHWSALFVDELDFRSMGKGISPMLSRAGALAECAEWLTTQEIDQLPGYLAAHQEDVPDALPIEDLVLHIATATPPVLEQIKALDEAKHWVEGTSLLTGATCRVPLVYLQQINGPNGKAAGNRLEEALVHGTLEVFERRAHVTVLRQRLVQPTYDPGTIHHPIIRELMDFLESVGIEMTIKDLSFDGVLPCVGVYFSDPNIPEAYQFRHFFKVGSSFSREEALLRCFTEYVQGRKLDEFIDGRPEEQDRILRHDFRQLPALEAPADNLLSAFMFGFVPYRDAAFLREGPMQPFDPGETYQDCLEDIDAAREICDLLGKEYIAVDLSDPDIDFAVAQVIIPGYSDALPFHPASSPALFRPLSRTEVLQSYGIQPDPA